MSEYQKPLDQKTIDIVAREWDRGIKEGRSFSVYAKVFPTPDGGEQDTIFLVKNNGGIRGRKPIGDNI